MERRTTIVAPATPIGRSAIAVVRISGPRAGEVLARIVRGGPHRPPVRRPFLATIQTPSGEAVDVGLVTWYPSPGSYTGEDLVEISGHGNPRLVARVVRSAVEAGAEAAEPGEFTLRAFLNGKIGLLAAEAVRDLVDARTELAARLALDRLQDPKAHRTRLREARELVLAGLAQIEGELDVSAEEGEESGARACARSRAEEARGRLEELRRRAEKLDRVNEGVRIAITGPPNAGKSTLFNRLVAAERAIVSPIAGTTRDVLRETIDWKGIPVQLSDGAGLGETEDPIDREAIERARGADREADGRLVVIGPEGGGSEERIRRGEEFLAGRRGLVVLSKCDEGLAGGEEGRLPEGVVALSARSGWGWAAFERKLGALVGEELVTEASAEDLLGEFERRRVGRAAAALAEGVGALDRGEGLECVADDFRRALAALGEASGDGLTEELLGELFRRFCVGK